MVGKSDRDYKVVHAASRRSQITISGMDMTSSEEVHRENLTLAKRVGRGERKLRSRKGCHYQKDDGSGIHDNDVRNMSADEAGGKRKGAAEVLILNSIEVLILSPSNKSKRGDETSGHLYVQPINRNSKIR